jgi:hypothetical protein
MKGTHITLALVALAAGTARAQDTAVTTRPAPNLTVEAVLTRMVLDRVPQDTVASIPAPAGMDSLFLWTRVMGADPGTVIHHVWFHGDAQVADVELPVNGSPWRTWSKKVISAESTGAWKVEVRDAAGNVLQTVQFMVGQGIG